MKRLLAASLAWPLLFASLPSAHADLALPPLPAGAKVKFAVEVDERADQPRLRIPKSLLQGGPKADDKEEAALPSGPTRLISRVISCRNCRNGSESPSLTPENERVGPLAPTLFAGLALTAAFVSGGFWLVRRGRGPGGAAAALVLALSLLGMGASAVWGDIPRPPRPRGAVQLAMPAGVQLSDNVVIEWVDKGDVVTLVVNKKMVLDQKPAPSGDKSDKE